MAQLRNILFDLDGTLTDPKVGVTRCIRFALEKMGIDPARFDDLDWCIGPPLQESFGKILATASSSQVVPQSHVAQALAHYRERYRELGIFENHVYAGIPECLSNLSSRARLFVATSKLEAFAVEVLRHFGLEARFQKIYGSGPDGERSDKGELIMHLLTEEKLDPASVAIVGDRAHDQIGAVKNGITGLGAAWGYGSEAELRDAGARAVFWAPSEVTAYFRERWYS